MSQALELEKVSISYDGLPAVRDVSLRVDGGTVFGLIGGSGSGKSTIGLSVLGLLPRNAGIDGKIWVEGIDLGKLSSRELRSMRGSRVALISQNAATALDPCFTIGNQFRELLRVHGSVSRREAGRVAGEWLERVGLPEPGRCLRAYPHQLSGGMNQRVLIGMALSLDPAVLVADEPTSALDVTVQAEILALLGRLVIETSAAALLISHDLGVVRYLARDVAVMSRGEIVESGPMDLVFGHPEHGYTKHLLRSVPAGRRSSTIRAESERIDGIGGE